MFRRDTFYRFLKKHILLLNKNLSVNIRVHPGFFHRSIRAAQMKRNVLRDRLKNCIRSVCCFILFILFSLSV